MLQWRIQDFGREGGIGGLELRTSAPWDGIPGESIGSEAARKRRSGSGVHRGGALLHI